MQNIKCFSIQNNNKRWDAFLCFINKAYLPDICYIISSIQSASKGFRRRPSITFLSRIEKISLSLSLHITDSTFKTCTIGQIKNYIYGNCLTFHLCMFYDNIFSNYFCRSHVSQCMKTWTTWQLDLKMALSSCLKETSQGIGNHITFYSLWYINLIFLCSINKGEETQKNNQLIAKLLKEQNTF